MDPFAALADPVRRELLRALADRPRRVVDLAAAHPISRPAISKHLRLLTEAGLAVAEDRGRERHYALVPDGLRPVQGLLDELRPSSAPGPRFAEADLDGLDLEVRRTVRERRTTTDPSTDASTTESQEDTA